MSQWQGFWQSFLWTVRRTLHGVRWKRLKWAHTAGARRTNTRADSGLANFCAADQTGRGSTRCRIYMSKRFIVRTENRTATGQEKQQKLRNFSLCARRFFFLFAILFLFFIMRYQLPVWICAEVREWRLTSLACFMCI